MRKTFAEKMADIAGNPDECWLWPLSRNTYGYGQTSVNKKNRTTHRLAYELLVGPIPEGMVLDHLCRVRHCVNPSHLRVVTNRENVLCGVSFAAVNAKKTHCRHGHEFTPQNTRIDRRGKRYCRTCSTEWARGYRENPENRAKLAALMRASRARRKMMESQCL